MTVSAVGVGNSSIVIGTPSVFRELLVRHIVYPAVSLAVQTKAHVRRSIAAPAGYCAEVHGVVLPHGFNLQSVCRVAPRVVWIAGLFSTRWMCCAVWCCVTLQCRGQLVGLTGLLSHLFLMRILTEASVHYCLSHLIDAMLVVGGTLPAPTAPSVVIAIPIAPVVPVDGVGSAFGGASAVTAVSSLLPGERELSGEADASHGDSKKVGTSSGDGVSSGVSGVSGSGCIGSGGSGGSGGGGSASGNGGGSGVGSGSSVGSDSCSGGGGNNGGKRGDGIRRGSGSGQLVGTEPSRSHVKWSAEETLVQWQALADATLQMVTLTGAS